MPHNSSKWPHSLKVAQPWFLKYTFLVMTCGYSEDNLFPVANTIQEKITEG